MIKSVLLGLAIVAAVASAACTDDDIDIMFNQVERVEQYEAECSAQCLVEGTSDLGSCYSNCVTLLLDLSSECAHAWELSRTLQGRSPCCPVYVLSKEQQLS